MAERLSEAVGGRRYIYRAKVPSPLPAVGAPDGTGTHRQRADTGRKVGRAARFGFRHGLRAGFAAGAHRLSRARGQSSALAWPDGGDALVPLSIPAAPMIAAVRWARRRILIRTVSSLPAPHYFRHGLALLLGSASASFAALLASLRCAAGCIAGASPRSAAFLAALRYAAGVECGTSVRILLGRWSHAARD